MSECKKEKLLKELAELTVRVGINVQKGQLVVINAPISAGKLVRYIVEAAYVNGAGKVMVSWSDDECTKYFYQYASDERLEEVPGYSIERLKYIVEQKGALISVLSPNPDIMKEIDGNKMVKAQIALGPHTQFFHEYTMGSRGQWTVISYPNEVWAHKVFPELPEDEAVEKLLEAILYTSRIEEGKSVENWQNHIANLSKHNKALNDYNFKTLKFKNGLGTDLAIDLVENHVWGGGNEATPEGIYFVPNIPTEETFTMPHRNGVNGTVVNTLPLSYSGQLIKHFKLTFKDGIVVDYESEDNKAVLDNIFSVDEGSKRLGEVALISNNSPISNLKILFYNTLFDENASCHLALGNAYPMNVKNGTEMTEEELVKIGYNKSLNHIDFMFGSPDMEIDGITHDGKSVAVFRKGNFII